VISSSDDEEMEVDPRGVEDAVDKDNIIDHDKDDEHADEPPEEQSESEQSDDDEDSAAGDNAAKDPELIEVLTPNRYIQVPSSARVSSKQLWIRDSQVRIDNV
jgi:hypothetical protein